RTNQVIARNIAKCAVNVVCELIKEMGPQECQTLKPLTDLLTLLIKEAPNDTVIHKTPISELVLSNAKGADPEHALATASTIEAMAQSSVMERHGDRYDKRSRRLYRSFQRP
ncbi:hypothetical protein PMAYCL1PPCAC_31491, partial [Pristionchus mayeri]